MIALTERRNQDTKNIDLMSSLEIVKAINNEDMKVAAAVQKVLPEIAKAVDLIAEGFRKNGRLAYFGAGTSGRLGILDASECLPTFGVAQDMVQGFIAGGERAIQFPVENAEDKEELGIEDLQKFNPTENDVVVGISAAGNAPYVVAVLQKAKEKGAKTVAISSNPDGLIGKICDVFINPIVGEEALTGSSRMKSGTAQKMVLNMLSTGAMIRIGKAYENYMVDLKILNKKLVDRACRFVSEIAEVNYETAQELIEKTNSVKEACVMAKCDCSREKARSLLAENGGILRKVID